MTTVNYADLPRKRNWFTAWGKWVFLLFFVALVALIAAALMDDGDLPDCDDKQTVGLLDQILQSQFGKDSHADVGSIVTKGDIDDGRGHLCSANVDIKLFGNALGKAIIYTVELNDKGDQFLVQIQN